jgi:hypothetical protein
MRKVLFGAPALLAVLALAASANAAINYNAGKSNTGSVVFGKSCKSLGGTPVTVNGVTSCKAGPKGLPAGAATKLSAACTQDHGKVVQKGGASTCAISAADQRTYTAGK